MRETVTANLRIQATDLSLQHAYEMHRAAAHATAAQYGEPLELSTMDAVLKADEFEIETLRNQRSSGYFTATMLLVLAVAVFGLATYLLVTLR